MKPSNNEPPTNWPRPEEFPPGSLQSKAAARLLAGKRKASGFYIHIHDGRECEHCKRNEHGPNDMIITINNIAVLEDEPHEPTGFDAKVRPGDEAAPSLPQKEQIAASTAPPKTKPESSDEPTEHWNDYLVHEEHAPLVEARRRPLVRPSLQRRRAWWRYGL